ncbi:hypothetical protein ACFX1S_041778 [Malus domestica]
MLGWADSLGLHLVPYNIRSDVFVILGSSLMAASAPRFGTQKMRFSRLDVSSSTSSFLLDLDLARDHTIKA